MSGLVRGRCPGITVVSGERRTAEAKGSSGIRHSRCPNAPMNPVTHVEGRKTRSPDTEWPIGSSALAVREFVDILNRMVQYTSARLDASFARALRCHSTRRSGAARRSDASITDLAEKFQMTLTA